MDNQEHFDEIKKKYGAEGKDINFIKSVIKSIIKEKSENIEKFEDSHEHKELVEELNILKKYDEQKQNEIIKSEVEISIVEKKEIVNMISEKLPSIISKQIADEINELSTKAVADKESLKQRVEKFESRTKEIKKELKGKRKTPKVISSVMLAMTFLWQLPDKWKGNVLAQQIVSIDSNVFKIIWTSALITCLFILALYKIKELDYDKKVEEYENEVFQYEVFQKFDYGHHDESFNKKDLIEYINYYIIKKDKELEKKKRIERNFLPDVTINEKIVDIFKYSISSDLLESLADLIIEKSLIKGAIIKKDSKTFLDRYEFGEYRSEIDFTDMGKTRLYDFDNIVVK